MRCIHSPKQWSIAFILQWGILALVALQSCLLLGAFLAGGVLTSSKDYASQVFAEKVGNRLLTLQNDMIRWARLDETATALATLPFVETPYKATQEDMRVFWQQAYPLLLQLMRSAGVTDSFIILSNNEETQGNNSAEVPPAEGTPHKALYLRKTDPSQNDTDTNILIGNPQLALDQGIYFSPSWTPDLTLTPENRAIFDKPLSLTATGIQPSLMAYWSPPVAVSEGSSTKAITYTMPLVDNQGIVRGVLGVGILESHFDILLPAYELAQDGLGYILAITPEGRSDHFPLIHTRSRQLSLFPFDTPIQLIPQNPAQNIFQVVPFVQNPDSEAIAACVLPLQTYATQTPFGNDKWVLVGLVDEKNLYAFPMRIRQILLFSLAASLLLGGILAVLFSRRITTPIVNLARSVEESRNEMPTTFPRTGVAEVDRLTAAMEHANRNMVNTTARLMRIVDMANVPFGAFELKPSMPQVFATERLHQLLQISETEAALLYNNVPAFMEHLRLLMATPEPEEEAIYRVSEDPAHWVKIHIAHEHSDIIGIISNATDEMLQKRRIWHDRDYDALTGLSSRTFFRRQVSTLMDLRHMLNLSAMLTLNIDNFNAVNAAYGTECGDKILSTFAKHMSEFSGIHSVLGRRSGDMFFVFMFRIAEYEALRTMVRRFYQRLNDAPFAFPDGTSRLIVVSIGIAWFNGNADFETLLRTADIALGEVKATAPGTMKEYRKIL